MKENTIDTNFVPRECIIFVQSTKIWTHKNKAIHSTCVDVIIILIVLRQWIWYILATSLVVINIGQLYSALRRLQV